MADLARRNSIQEQVLEALHFNSSLTVTWMNHHSALASLSAGVLLESFDIVGIDGLFLRRLLRTDVDRTSADLLLPHILNQSQCSVGIIGGKVEGLDLRIKAFQQGFPANRLCWASDGYEGAAIEKVTKLLKSETPDLIIVGLGPVKQEQLAVLIQSLTPEQPTVVVTCGGWLDQNIQKNYYPGWAYPLKLNWLVRLLREPRRLWRRYTVDAWLAFHRRKDLRTYLRHIA